MLLCISAFSVTVSAKRVLSSPVSPKTKLPSKVILPEAFKLPVTFVLACSSIVPVPFGKKFTSELVT